MEEKRYTAFLKLVGTKVRKRRIEKGYTMQELANEADIEIRQLGRIERGEINTTLTSLKKVADALDEDVHIFLLPE